MTKQWNLSEQSLKIFHFQQPIAAT